MHILFSIIKALIIYFICCAASFFILWISGRFINIDYTAWRAYEYLHSQYGFYDDIENYDFNPALGDFLLFWLLLFPGVITFAILIFNKKRS